MSNVIQLIILSLYLAIRGCCCVLSKSNINSLETCVTPIVFFFSLISYWEVITARRCLPLTYF